MNILVIGCGKIGSTIISSLVAEGHDVTALDNNPKTIEYITNIYDVIGVCGNGADSDVLEEAGANKMQLVVAATGSDELNMLSCFLAKRMVSVVTVITPFSIKSAMPVKRKRNTNGIIKLADIGSNTFTPISVYEKVL